MKKDAKFPEETLECVPEGPAWWVFFPVWNLIKSIEQKSWLFLLILIFGYYVIWIHHDFFFDHHSGSIFSESLFFENSPFNLYLMIRLLVIIFLTINANDFWRKKLEYKGYELVDVLAASNEIEAQRRFFDKQVKRR